MPCTCRKCAFIFKLVINNTNKHENKTNKKNTKNEKKKNKNSSNKSKKQSSGPFHFGWEQPSSMSRAISCSSWRKHSGVPISGNPPARENTPRLLQGPSLRQQPFHSLWLPKDFGMSSFWGQLLHIEGTWTKHEDSCEDVYKSIWSIIEWSGVPLRSVI